MLELGVEELGRSLMSEKLSLCLFRPIIDLAVVIEFVLGGPTPQRLPWSRADHKDWNKIVCDAGYK